jgi:hypothetical protein
MATEPNRAHDDPARLVWPLTSVRCNAAIFSESKVDRTCRERGENGAHGSPLTICAVRQMSSAYTRYCGRVQMAAIAVFDPLLSRHLASLSPRTLPARSMLLRSSWHLVVIAKSSHVEPYHDSSMSELPGDGVNEFVGQRRPVRELDTQSTEAPWPGAAPLRQQSVLDA